MNMNTTITIEIKNNYGKQVFYPANDQAQTIARIAGTKTLSETVLSNCKTLGFEIVVKSPVLNF